MKEIVLSGPNLQLDDLRWLVDRCQELSGKAKVRIEAATAGDPLYPRIVIEDQQPRTVYRGDSEATRGMLR